MRGVGPGTVIGGRYTLQHRLSQDRDLERWSAHDVTLERDVTLIIVGVEHPSSAGLLDAARRAAGVADTRLVRILDVGTQSELSFIVEEAMTGSESLATILLQGPLHAEEARRIAGETAQGLESARQRGLHHLRLTPRHIMISPDGAIRVSGVAVAAAADGQDVQELDPATASRRDALRLVAVVYAALTGRWPLAESVYGMEPAPKVADGVAVPSEIVAGVPKDLDALCRMSLNAAAGPLTPGDFANCIAPWPREPALRAAVDPTVVMRLPGQEVKETDATAPGDATQTLPTLAGGTEPTVTFATTFATQEVPASDPSNGSAKPASPPPAGSTPAGSTPARPTLAWPPLARPLRSMPRPAPSDPEAVPAPIGNKVAPAGAATASVPGAPAGAATASVPGAPPTGAAAGKLSSATGAAQENRNVTDPDQEIAPMKLPEGLSSQVDDGEPPLPLLPSSTAQQPSRSQSKIVMLVVAAFMVLALVVGYRGLTGPGDSTTAGKTSAKPTAVSAPPATVPASPAPQSGTTAAGPIAILSATGFDPEGDESEGNSKAARVYDGDLATAWTSELYATAQLGNLKKGAGVLLDLGQPTSVHEVTIDLGAGPVDVTAYAATDSSLEGATVLGTATSASGRIQLKATRAMPETQYVIVWFTSLAPDGGQYRASVSEIALS